MSTRRVATIAVVSSLAGLVVGACGASWYWLGFNGKFMASSLVLRTQADIIAKVSVLEHMRAGRTEEAAKLQETLLDGDLVIAGALARDGNGFNANARRAVALEAHARNASGYEPSDPTVRVAVKEAFGLLQAGAGASIDAQPGAAGYAR